MSRERKKEERERKKQIENRKWFIEQEHKMHKSPNSFTKFCVSKCVLIVNMLTYTLIYRQN